jgi:hypothetical protein
MKKITILILTSIFCLSYSQDTNTEPIPVKTSIKTSNVVKLPKTVLPKNIVIPKGKNSMNIDFKTGDDNLDHRDFQKNVDVKITFNGKPDLFLENVNKSQNWPNNSVRRYTTELTDNITVQDIKTISVIRGNASGSWNNIDGAMADNWNLAQLIVTANIYENAVAKKYILADLKGNRIPVYRFIYENRNPCDYCGNTFNYTFLHNYNSTLPPAATTEKMNAKLTFVIGTGGDNLEGGNNNNVDIIIRMKNSPEVYTLRNINAKRKWNNFTEATRVIEIVKSKEMDINNIKEIEIRHTGGGGIGADNWDVDKININISKDGITRNLIDKVGTPIKRFTGDNRALIVRF